MRDPKRIERILYKVGVLWDRNPDWRLGQLIDNAIHDGGSADPYYAEDDVLERGLDKLIARSVNAAQSDD